MKTRKILSVITAAVIAVSNAYIPVYAEEIETIASVEDIDENESKITSEPEETNYSEEVTEIGENEETEVKESESEVETISEIKSETQETVIDSENNSAEQETITQSESSSQEETESKPQESTEITTESETQEEISSDDAEEETTEITEEVVQVLDNEELDYKYIKDGDEITITKYIGKETDVVIPSEIEQKKVTSIGPQAFDGCSSVISIKLPAEITSIGINAFSNCNNLTNIELPAGITNIDYAFMNCSSLTNIELPAGITSIEGTFSNCSSLTNIELPAGITNIDYAFNNCSSLTSIELPAGITNIGEYTFYGCSSLTSIKLSAGITGIGQGAFSRCSSLTNIELPAGITSIGAEAFFECGNLTSIELPKGVTSIGRETFSGCEMLQRVILPAGITSIGQSAFDGCSSLTDIELPAGITSIGQSAFDGCSSLTSIDLPAGITNIGTGAFYACDKLESITIPGRITTIWRDTFAECDKLKSITISKSVKRIEVDAFSNCDYNLNIYYEGTEEEWKQIKFDDNWIDDYSSYYIHYNCVISNDSRLDSVITIASDKQNYIKMYGDTEFKLEGISKTGDGTIVYTVTAGNDVVEVSPSGMVTIKNVGKAVITISMAATDNYKEAASRTISIIVNEKAEQIESDYQYREKNGELTIIGYTGSGRNILVPAEIDGKKVTSIGEYAFSECEMLQSVILPDGITCIEEDAFSDCKMLQNIVLPDGITSIGEYAFSWCETLQNIILPDSITSIGEYAFYGCSSLTSIRIPRGVTYIRDGIFSDCNSLQSITIHKNVVRIGGYAFDFDTEIANFVMDIYYEGTSEEWKQIKKNGDWFKPENDELIRYKVHYNCVLSEDTLLDSSITIPNDRQNYTKTYGDTAFGLEGIEKTGDGTLIYTVTSGNDVIDVSSSGMVTIKNAGTAVITVSMAATDTYKEAESKTISITVNKKAHTNVAQQTVSLDYKKGSNGEKELDFSKLIARDAGNTTYAIGTETDNSNILTTSIDPSTGILKYTVQSGSIGTTASVQVIATMRNYNDCVIALQVKLEEKEESSGSEESSSTEESSGSGESSSTEESSGNEESSSTEESSGSEESSSTEESSDSEEKDDTFSVAAIAPQDYTGTSIRPDVVVTHGGKRLVLDQDYTLTYKNNTKAGTATVIIKGKGNYFETQTITFLIEKKDLNSSGVIIDDLALAYNGKVQKKAPDVTYKGKKLKAGSDYTVSYGNGSFKDPGTYTVTISGKGNFKGEVFGKVVILDKSMMIKNAKVSLSQKQYDYTGNEIRPSVTVTLKGKTLTENKDYTVSYADNIMPGKAAVVIKGKDSYAGTKKVNFTIKKQVVNLAENMVSVPSSVVYEKGGCMPEPTVTAGNAILAKGTDYTVSYKNNKKVGTAAIVIKGKGIYKGTVSKSFTITPKDISKTFMRAQDVIYTSNAKAGKYISKPILTDTNGNVLGTSDYMNIVYVCGKETLNKKSKPAVGSTIKVTVTGKGNYTGTASTEYTLKNATAFSKAKISVAQKTFTGGKVTLQPSDVKVALNGKNLEYGKDYEIIVSSYKNNTKKGTAQVTFKGIGSYAGEKVIKFKITARNINSK